MCLQTSNWSLPEVLQAQSTEQTANMPTAAQHFSNKNLVNRRKMLCFELGKNSLKKKSLQMNISGIKTFRPGDKHNITTS